MWRRAGLLWAAVAGLVLLTGGAVTAAPELRVEPASGQPGDTVAVIGAGLEPGDVELRWGSESGPLLGTATGPEFVLDVVVPADAVPDSYPVVAVVRDGRAVSTSNTSFQVTPAEPDREEPPTTTGADPVPAEPSPGRGGSDPVGGRSVAGGPSRGSLGITGGLGGDATEPVLPTTEGQPAIGSDPGAAGAGTSTPSADGGTATTMPAAAAGQGSDPAAPSDRAAAAGAHPSAQEPSGAALSPRAAGQSSGAVRSPALLLVGIAMVLGGGAVLAFRNRRRPEEVVDLS